MTPPDHCEGGSWQNNETFPTYNTACDQPYCIFDVVDDAAEEKDLSGTTAGAAAGANLIARLRVLSRSGAQEPGLSYPGRSSAGYRAVLKPMICARANATGFWLPADWPVAVPPAPPAPASCGGQLKRDCPPPFEGGAQACLKCSRLHHGSCSPKERQAYCGNRTTTVATPAPHDGGDSAWHY